MEARLAAATEGCEGAHEAKLVNGIAYFGLCYPAVVRLLLQLPGADACAAFGHSKKAECLAGGGGGAGSLSDGEVEKAAERERSPTPASGDGDRAGDWMRLMQQELADLKNKTRQTIQPLSHSQLQPEGWSGAEVDSFFNALYAHPMDMNGLASVIVSKNPQQVCEPTMIWHEIIFPFYHITLHCILLHYLISYCIFGKCMYLHMYICMYKHTNTCQYHRQQLSPACAPRCINTPSMYAM